MNIKLEIELDYDPDTKEVSVISCIPVETEDTRITYPHTLTGTQVKFGILTLGKKFGKWIPCGVRINLYVNETPEGSITTHKKVGGRIDGLTSLYKKYADLFQEGTTLRITYDNAEHSLYIADGGNEDSNSLS